MASALLQQVSASCINCPFQERLYELERINAELENRIAALEAKLAKFENPHVPSSMQRFKEKEEGTVETKKRGAPKGHKGATRPMPTPDEIVEVTADFCEQCGSRNLSNGFVEETIIEDLPPPPKIKIIQYNKHTYECQDCGHEFTAKHPDCPQEGLFGIHLLVYITMLKFGLRGVLRGIGDFTLHTNSFDISPTGIHDMLLRVGKVCEKEYFRTLGRVRYAQWRYIDETGMGVKGKNWWLWIFRTTTDILVVIRPSRGKKVLEEILGVKINGGGIADGWRAYNVFEVLQRCWAHLIREIDAFDDKSEGKDLSEIIHKKFKELREFLDKGPPMQERVKQKKVWDEEMVELVEQFDHFEQLKKPITYLRNGLGQWYTCLLYPGMEPTNNLGEQALREHVIMRKIIGTFRSENGAKNYQYIASMIATWKLQRKDIYREMENLLRAELCIKVA